MAGDDAEEMSIKNVGWVRIKTPGTVIGHKVAAPASELFSVGVGHKYFGERDTCDVYGTIIIDDEDGISHQLYCRSPDDPQTLTPDHNLLSFNMPPECSASTTWSRMSLVLKDMAAHDAVIAHHVLGFDKFTSYNNDQYDQVNVRQLAAGSVFVTYAAFRAALVAIIEITLIKTNDSATAAAAALSGKIVASHGNTYGPKYPGIMLFNRPSNHPVRAVSNIPIELSRDVMVVPAYSFLRIDLQLSEPLEYQQEDIIGRVEFLTSFPGTSKYLDVEAKDFVIRVHVDWYHPYELKNEAKESLKCPKIPDLLALDVSRDPYCRSEAFRFVEFFAIMIHHDTNSVLRVGGSLKTCDIWLKSVFSRNELNPVIISKNMESILIEGPSRRCIEMQECLSIELDLRDVEGKVSIQGDLGWSKRLIKRPLTWYDRRICSVIPGMHGYALVFYTIFSTAVQAIIKVSFICSSYPDISHRAHGTIAARYSNQVYLTEHDKSYYQSVLFRGNSSELKSACILPLSKSVVAVPIDACLIVGVDLYVRSQSHELPGEHLKKDVGFGIVPGACICQRIESKNYCIEVSLEWRHYYKSCLEDKLFRENSKGDS